MVLPVTESLAHYGFNQKENISSRKNFRQQLESYALHVIEDKPVSNSYSYFIDDGEIYIDKDKMTKLLVDLEERDGLATYGTQKAVALAQAFTGNIVFFYSPPGPVAFRKGTKYDQLKPYSDGQLYLLVGNHDQVDSLAVSISKDSEKQALQTFLGEENIRSGFDSEIDKIKYYLTSPIVSDMNIDNLLNNLKNASEKNNFLVFENVHKEKFYLSDIMDYIWSGWLQEINPALNLDYDLLFDIAKRQGAETAYQQEIRMFFPLLSEGGKLKLGGGCGGSIVTESDFDTFNPIKDIIQDSPLSTGFRLQMTTIKDILKKNEDSDEYGSLKFHCPMCSSEHVRKPHILMTHCPKNGKEIPKC